MQRREGYGTGMWVGVAGAWSTDLSRMPRTGGTLQYCQQTI